MSNTTKNLIEEIFNRQDQQEKSVGELKHINKLFTESEKAKQAKELIFGEKLESLKSQFSSFFIRKSAENQGAV